MSFASTRNREQGSNCRAASTTRANRWAGRGLLDRSARLPLLNLESSHQVIDCYLAMNHAQASLTSSLQACGYQVPGP